MFKISHNSKSHNITIGEPNSGYFFFLLFSHFSYSQGSLSGYQKSLRGLVHSLKFLLRELANGIRVAGGCRFYSSFKRKNGDVNFFLNLCNQQKL